MINCLILAGNEENQLSSKAFIELQGKPMIMYVIDALRSSNQVDKIAVVGEKNQLTSLGTHIDMIIDSNDSMLNNIAAGVKYFKDDSMLLISTCDIPLLTGEAVADFIGRSLELKSDICYPIISKTTCQQAFPEARRTYATLKEGQFTGGNLFMLNPAILDKGIDIAEQMISYRKSPAKMSRVLGLPFLLKLAAGRLSIEEVENRVSKLLNIRGKAIISNYAEIGNDVDKPEDIETIEKLLERVL